MSTASAVSARRRGAQLLDDPRLAATTYVWAVFGASVLLVLWLVTRYGMRFPYTDDFDLLPAATGKQAMDVHYLFAAHNEHYIPLPKLLLTALLRMTGCDFRSGLVLNALLLSGVVAAILIQLRARRGWNSWTDVFVPLMLMDVALGPFVWDFQLQFTLSTCLIATVLVLSLGGQPLLARRRSAGAYALVLLLLPLCGLNGIAAVPVLVAFGAVLLVRHRRVDVISTAVGVSMLVSTVLSLVLAYKGISARQAPGASADETVIATVHVVASAFGPTIATKWPISALLALVAVGPALLVALLALRSATEHALGLVAVALATGSVALSVGVGRGAVWTADQDRHYALLAVPLLLAAYCCYATLPQVAAGGRELATVALASVAIAAYVVPAIEVPAYQRGHAAAVDALDRALQAEGPTPAVVERAMPLVYYIDDPRSRAVVRDGLALLVHR